MGDLAGRGDGHDQVAKVVALLEELEFIQEQGQESRQFVIPRIDLERLQELPDDLDTIAQLHAQLTELDVGIRLVWFDLQRSLERSPRIPGAIQLQVQDTQLVMDASIERIFL